MQGWKYGVAAWTMISETHTVAEGVLQERAPETEEGDFTDFTQRVIDRLFSRTATSLNEPHKVRPGFYSSSESGPTGPDAGVARN